MHDHILKSYSNFEGMHKFNSEYCTNLFSCRTAIDLSTALMTLKYHSRNRKPDSIKANSEAAGLLRSLFTKDIVERGEKSRK